MKKLPVNLFIRIENEGSEDEFLAAEVNLPCHPDNHGERVGEYRLVREGKIDIQDPQVNWKK